MIPSLLCKKKSKKKEKKFDMHNESESCFYVPLLLPDFQLCYAMWLSLHAFHLKHTIYIHTLGHIIINARLKRQLLSIFPLSSTFAVLASRAKIKWLNMLLFRFCIRGILHTSLILMFKMRMRNENDFYLLGQIWISPEGPRPVRHLLHAATKI